MSIVAASVFESLKRLPMGGTGVSLVADCPVWTICTFVVLLGACHRMFRSAKSALAFVEYGTITCFGSLSMVWLVPLYVLEYGTARRAFVCS